MVKTTTRPSRLMWGCWDGPAAEMEAIAPPALRDTGSTLPARTAVLATMAIPIGSHRP